MNHKQKRVKPVLRATALLSVDELILSDEDTGEEAKSHVDRKIKGADEEIRKTGEDCESV
jgi:hypothetical protein